MHLRLAALAALAVLAKFTLLFNLIAVKHHPEYFNLILLTSVIALLTLDRVYDTVREHCVSLVLDRGKALMLGYKEQLDSVDESLNRQSKLIAQLIEENQKLVRENKSLKGQ